MSRSPVRHRRLLKVWSLIAIANTCGCASMGLPLATTTTEHGSPPRNASRTLATQTGEAQPGFANGPASAGQGASIASPVAPVAHAGQTGAVDPMAVAQVAHFGGETAPACGCPSCAGAGGGDFSQTPHGYAYQPMPWNAYGIDAQEFLCDGGDQPPEVMIRRDDSLVGLDLEDTVVHYTTEQGDVHVEASNRACLYAPRFASVRKISGAAVGERAIGAVGIGKPVAAGRFEFDQPGLVVRDSRELAHAEVASRLDAVRDRDRGVRIENILQPEQATDVLAVLAGLTILELDQLRDSDLALLRQAAQAAVTWTIDESVEIAIEDVAPPTLVRDQTVEGFTVYDFPDAGRLRIGKLADRHDALPGEIVTFLLRVDNVGDSAVTDVLVTDNLTTRLEYIEGSQTASGGAIFSSERNEGDSQRLTWKLTDQLRVGESVTIRFRCRVR